MKPATKRRRFKIPVEFKRGRTEGRVEVMGRIGFESRIWNHRGGRVRVRSLRSEYEERVAWYVEISDGDGGWDVASCHRVKPAAFRAAAREARWT